MSSSVPFVKFTGEYLHIYRGIVKNNVDPNTTAPSGRCQIEVWPMFKGIVTTDLPWAIPANNIFEGSGTGIGSFAVPKIGTKVWVFFEEGNPYQPVYFAEATDQVSGIPVSALTNYPNRKVWRTTQGIEVIVDDTSKEYIINHPTGTQILIDTTGNITINTVQQLNLTSTVKTIITASEADINTSGATNITASGQITLHGSQINLNAP